MSENDPAKESGIVDVPRRWVLPLLLTGSIAFLVGSAGFLKPGGPGGRDNPSHLAEIERIARCLQEGRTDFWFDETNLGYPLFIAYQPLPSLLMGAVVALTKRIVDSWLVFKLSVIAIWALMPFFWYRGGRWLGFDRATALFFALLPLVVGDWANFGLGTASSARNGLYTQAWGTALLPLLLGAFRRHIDARDMSLLAPAALFSLLVLCHAFLAFLAAVAMLSMTLSTRRELGVRLLRLGAVVAITALWTGFWLVPFLSCRAFQGGYPGQGDYGEGYALSELGLRVLRGDLLDSGRRPWVTLMAGAGILAVCWSREHRSPWWLAATGVFSFEFLLGPEGWGQGYRSIPFHQGLEVIRYVAGLHLVGICLAAVGLTAGLRLAVAGLAKIRGLTRRVAPARLFAFAVAAAALALPLCRVVTWKRDWTTFDTQAAPFADLVREVAAGRDRFACLRGVGTGDSVHYNLLPLLAGRPQLLSLARGAHDTHSVYFAQRFFTAPEEMRLFNIRHLVGKRTYQTRPVHLTPVWHNSSYTIHEFANPGGYFDFVRLPIALTGPDLRSVREPASVVSAPLFRAGLLPRLSPGDSSSADRIERCPGGGCRLILAGKTVLDDAPPRAVLSELLERYKYLDQPKSRVLQEKVDLNQYVAEVEVDGSEDYLLLKSSHHPYWHASIDGRETDIVQVGPNLMAARMTPGRHEVIFRYRNPVYQKVGFVLSLLAAAVAGGISLRRRWRRRLSTPG